VSPSHFINIHLSTIFRLIIPADGRRPIYLSALPIYIIASFLCSASRSLATLAISRALQGFGTAAFATVGAATIADIYALTERGTAMGIYWGATLIGPAIAPAVGGFVSRYAGWRVMQIILGGAACGALGMVLLWMPETIHPGVAGWEADWKRSVARDRDAVWM
jgi:MFS family permease